MYISIYIYLTSENNFERKKGAEHKPHSGAQQSETKNRRIYKARDAGNTCRIVKALNKLLTLTKTQNERKKGAELAPLVIILS